MSKHRAPGPAVLVPAHDPEQPGRHSASASVRTTLTADYFVMRFLLAEEQQRESDRVAGERARRLVDSMGWRGKLAPARTLNIPQPRSAS